MRGLYAFGKPTGPRPLSEKLVARLQEPGRLDELRACLEVQRGNLCQRLAPDVAPARTRAAWCGAGAGNRTGGCAPGVSANHATPAGLMANLQDEQARLSVWQADGGAGLARLGLMSGRSPIAIGCSVYRN